MREKLAIMAVYCARKDPTVCPPVFWLGFDPWAKTGPAMAREIRTSARQSALETERTQVNMWILLVDGMGIVRKSRCRPSGLARGEAPIGRLRKVWTTLKNRAD